MLIELSLSKAHRPSYEWIESVQMQALVAEVFSLSDQLFSKDTFYFYTSGSTGTPKEVEFCREEISGSAAITADFFGLTRGAKVLLALPLKFVGGKMMVYRAALNDWDLWVTMPASNPIADLNTRVDFAAFTPHQLMTIFDQTPEKLKFIDIIICGGGRIGKTLQEKIIASGLKVFETYGMTETLTHVAVRAVHLHEHVFRALPGTHFERGGNDCLIIHSRHLRASPIVTGDLADVISPSEMQWRGRIDFVINTGGIKINPEKIEEILAEIFEFPFYVSSVYDDFLGEKMVICVEELPVDFPWQVRIRETSLQSFEMPREMIAVGTFDRTESGKIIRKRKIHEGDIRKQ